jgi:hypothetical protein
MDRGVIEFAARVPANLRMHPAYRKAFLRYACQGLLPDEVRWRPKRDLVYEELLAEELASDRARTLSHAATNGNLAGWVDSGQIAGLLARVRGGGNVPMSVQQKLRSLLAFVGWRQRVEGSYGGELSLA